MVGICTPLEADIHKLKLEENAEGKMKIIEETLKRQFLLQGWIAGVAPACS